MVQAWYCQQLLYLPEPTTNLGQYIQLPCKACIGIENNDKWYGDTFMS